MANGLPGLVQSQAHAEAAREHSAAKALLASGAPGAEELVASTHTKLRKALQAYIDPFKVHRQW